MKNIIDKFMSKNKWKDIISRLEKPDMGVSIRKLSLKNNEIYILYISQISDRDKISDNVIKPLLDYREQEGLTIDKIANSVIYVDDVSIETDPDKVLEHIYMGKSVILMLQEAKYVVANTVKIEKRVTESPQVQSTLRGPRDSFTENLDSNLSLIRYRLKNPSLRVENFTIGERTKTSVALVYLKDVANSEYVNDIRNRLKAIKVDGIIDSGHIQKFISNSALNIFPNTGIAERSDIACAGILEGKVCIVVEGSNLALLAPKPFVDYMDSEDDHYGNMYLGILSKILRAITWFVALTVSSLYVAIVSFHTDIIPPRYILILASFRETVPFNSYIEAMLMETIAEILREASIVLPKQIGPAIGIVGTIVIGQAAAASGIVSPVMVIIVALSTMSSFVIPDYTAMSPIRVLKMVLIFITGLFGLFGFIMGLTMIVINMISMSSFGVPYGAPVAPFNVKDSVNYMLSNINVTKKRPRYLNTKDKTRQ